MSSLSNSPESVDDAPAAEHPDGRDLHQARDVAYMRRALALADRAAGAGDVPVAAVLVVPAGDPETGDDAVIDAWNEKELRRDPTAHAEILALRAGAAARGAWRLSGATLYVTKEPCVMCAGAVVAARIARLVFGCPDPKGGAAGSVFDLVRSERLNHRVEVRAGVLGDEASEALRGFFASRRLAAQPVRPQPATGEHASGGHALGECAPGEEPLSRRAASVTSDDGDDDEDIGAPDVVPDSGGHLERWSSG